MNNEPYYISSYFYYCHELTSIKDDIIKIGKGEKANVPSIRVEPVHRECVYSITHQLNKKNSFRQLFKEQDTYKLHKQLNRKCFLFKYVCRVEVSYV